MCVCASNAKYLVVGRFLLLDNLLLSSECHHGNTAQCGLGLPPLLLDDADGLVTDAFPVNHSIGDGTVDNTSWWSGGLVRLNKFCVWWISMTIGISLSILHYLSLDFNAERIVVV